MVVRTITMILIKSMLTGEIFTIKRLDLRARAVWGSEISYVITGESNDRIITR